MQRIRGIARSTRAHKLRSTVIAVVLVSAVAFGAVSIGGNSNPAQAAQASVESGVDAPTPAVCAEGTGIPHYFAADVSQNFFGPAVKVGTVDEIRQELRDRRCQDPALVVAHAHVWELDGFKQLSGEEAFAAKIRELVGNRQLWRDTIDALEKQENACKASVATMSGPYETLYMVDGVTDVPLIKKAAPDKPAFKVLRFDCPSGKQVNFKLDCGFQPVAQEFPNVPPLTPPPPAIPEEKKCFDDAGNPINRDANGFCGSPNEGLEQQPVQSEPLSNPTLNDPTPGYTRGRAEQNHQSQQEAAADDNGDITNGDTYTSSPNGEAAPSEAGTTGATETPSGNTEEGTNEGVSDPDDSAGHQDDPVNEGDPGPPDPP